MSQELADEVKAVLNAIRREVVDGLGAKEARGELPSDADVHRYQHTLATVERIEQAMGWSSDLTDGA